MRQTLISVVIGLAVLISTPIAHADTGSRPNIVVLLMDDAAFMDFGAFGGEAKTPNIDAIAASGAMLTNYHTSPLCSPSRAMLLTGIDNHRAGVSTIEEVLPSELKGKPGYTLHLEPGVLTVASRLQQAGYRTYMVGKWHLGHAEGDLPNSHGFDRSLALDASGADNWEQKPYMPYYQDAPWFEDGKPTTLPKDFYSSELIVDRAINYIGQPETDARPFFAYIAFQAVHIPVQAPKEFSDRYKGQFDEGWDKLRTARWERAQKLGLIPQNAPLAPMHESARRWDTLSDAEKRIYARSMEVYAGMLEATDQYLGRLVDHLKSTGQYKNTIFIITSDNGPEPSDPVHAPGMSFWMMTHDYDWRLENLGEKGSLAFIGPEWAAAIASPGKVFKFYTSQGGLHVPLIVAGPGIAAGQKLNSLAFVTDVAPTILELAGATLTQPKHEVTITGRSLRPALGGEAKDIREPTEGVGTEVSGNSAFYRGTYKIVRYAPPYGDGLWHLHDLSVDPGETKDLATEKPEILNSMLADYAAYEKNMGVLPLPAGYDVQQQVAINAAKKQLMAYWWILLLIAAALALAVGAVWRMLRRRRPN